MDDERLKAIRERVEKASKYTMLEGPDFNNPVECVAVPKADLVVLLAKLDLAGKLLDAANLVVSAAEAYIAHGSPAHYKTLADWVLAFRTPTPPEAKL